MSMSEHERNYLPSEWSKRCKSGEMLLQQFVKFCKDVTSKARSSISNELNVPYGNTQGTKYDIYGTHLPEDAPIFVFIHGGYWQESSKDLATFPVNTLVSKGIRVIIAEYDLCPAVTLTDIVAEIEILVEKILKMALESSSKSVWVAGHSAGAQLAACLLYNPKWLERLESNGYLSLLKGIILLSGLYELKPLLTTSMNNALKLTNAEIENFSVAPIAQPHPRDQGKPVPNIKVLVAVGQDDSPIFVEESKRLAKRLISFVDNVEFLLLRNIDHFDIAENLTKNDFILTKWIIQNMLTNEETD